MSLSHIYLTLQNARFTVFSAFKFLGEKQEGEKYPHSLSWIRVIACCELGILISITGWND